MNSKSEIKRQVVQRGGTMDDAQKILRKEAICYVHGRALQILIAATEDLAQSTATNFPENTSMYQKAMDILTLLVCLKSDIENFSKGRKLK